MPTPQATNRDVISATQNYRATLARCAAPDAGVMVIFDFWSDAPTLDGEPPGEQFFLRHGFDVVGIKTARNDWYQGAEMPALCAAVVAATAGRRRVGYGGSMGGYAAINFAALLQLESVIAICPQVSIDAAKAPFERRWRAEAQALEFAQDRIAAGGPRARGYLVFDPHTVDAMHAARILDHNDLLPVPIRYGGHDQMLMLQQCGLLSAMLLDMVHGRFQVQSWLDTVRRRSRQSTVFWLSLARVLARRGRHRASHAALSRARTCRGSGAPGFAWQFHAALADCLLAAIDGRDPAPP